MHPLVLSLAYKFVAFSLMLTNINSFCERAGVPLDHRFSMTDIRETSNVGPAVGEEVNGSILTEKYFFGFGKGHLANFWLNDFKIRGDQNIQTRNLQLSKQASLIDSNAAFRIATNWLAALGVDCGAAESKYRREIIQWRYYPNGPEGTAVPLPIFQVQWMGNIIRNSPRERAAVTVTILGTTKAVTEHHVLDNTLFAPQVLRIIEREKLFAIPDGEFRSYTGGQHSNLVARFGRTSTESTAKSTQTQKETK